MKIVWLLLVMRPSIRNYFERIKKSVNDENVNISISQNGPRQRNYTSVLRRVRKYRERYRRKTPQQEELIRQKARTVYHQRKTRRTRPVPIFKAPMTVEEWCRIAEESKRKRLAKLSAIEREKRYERRTTAKLSMVTIPKLRTPRAMMYPDQLERARKKAREAQRKKRAGLTDEQRDAERQKGRERMRQKRATMTEEEKQILRQVGKERMRLKRASLNPEDREVMLRKQRERVHRKWDSLDPDKQEVQRQKRRERERRKWASLTPAEREEKRENIRQYCRAWRAKESIKKGKPPKQPKPVDISKLIQKSSAELLVVEEAQPLLSLVNRGVVKVPSMLTITSPIPNHPLVQESTLTTSSNQQQSTEELQTSVSTECEDQGVMENTSLAEIPSEQSVIEQYSDTIMVDQISLTLPFVRPAEVKWKLKVVNSESTTLQTGM